jgi:hypothetical protein
MACLFSGMIYGQDQQRQRNPGNRDGATVEERVKTQTDRMKTDLSLTDKQYESVKELNLKYAKKAEELFKKGRENASENDRDAFRKNQEERNKELKALLTDEQYKKYEAQEKERRERGREGRQRRNSD